MKPTYLTILILIIVSCTKTVMEYYPSGALKIEYQLNSQGQETGDYRVYYENGQQMVTIPFSEGIRNGIATYYDSTGYVCEKETYINGSVKKYESINKKGQVTYAFTNLDSIEMPVMEDFRITFSHRLDTFTVGKTTTIDIKCDRVSKNNLRILLSNGTTKMDWLKYNYTCDFTPNKTGRSVLTLYVQLTDSIPELHRIGSKEYAVTN